MTKWGSGAVRLVLAEDLRGEGRVAAEPSLCEGVVKCLESGRAKCGRSVEGEFGVLNCSCLRTINNHTKTEDNQ